MFSSLISPIVVLSLSPFLSWFPFPRMHFKQDSEAREARVTNDPFSGGRRCKERAPPAFNSFDRKAVVGWIKRKKMRGRRGETRFTLSWVRNRDRKIKDIQEKNDSQNQENKREETSRSSLSCSHHHHQARDGDDDDDADHQETETTIYKRWTATVLL